MSDLPEVWIYCDGGCQPNPGRGAWACVLLHLADRYLADDHKRRKELSGTEPDTTNNCMELLAAIMGLEALKRECRVTIHTDSQWVIQCAMGQWSRASNTDLWQRYDEVAARHSISWKKVKGHSGDRWNERCHAMVTQRLSGMRTPSA